MIKKSLFFFSLLFICTGCTFASSKKSEIMEPREVFVSSDGASLFCRTLGKGEPLVVVHGGPGLTHEYLLPGLDRLAENHFVIFYDQRGAGRSTGEIDEETLHLPALIKDLENIRKAFGFKKISLLGHSWGGMVSARYAIAHPESVNKLILSNSIPLSSEDLSLFFQEWMRRMAPYQEEIAAIRTSQEYQEGNPELHEKLNRLIFRNYCYLPEDADKLDLHLSQTAALHCLKINEVLRGNTLTKPFNLYADLKNLQIPTLIIHADEDPIPLVTAQHIHESISHSEYIVIEHCGHFPYVEEPETYFKSIEEFLK